MTNRGYLVGFPATTHWRNRGETVRIHDRQIPGSEAAHAQPGNVDSVSVYGIDAHDLGEQRIQHVSRPPQIGGTLRRDDDKGVVLAIGDISLQPLVLDSIQVVAAQTRAMQRQNQGPFLRRIVVLRQIQQITYLAGVAVLPREGMSFLFTRATHWA